ncbi:MAG: PASTA domain-containing protein [Thermodesulfobacteriota bacterium]
MTERKGSSAAMVAGLLLVALVGVLVLLLKDKLFTGSAESPGEVAPVEQEAGATTGRKNIYDRNFVELAVGFRRSSLYARPLELESPEEVAGKVAKVLGVEEKELLPALKGERSFSWVGRDIPPNRADLITEQNLKGVYRVDQVYRYYPGNQLGAHVVGFLKDEQGLAGVEFYYDSILRGGGGYEPRLAAAGASRRVVEGQVGASLVLTVDIRVQELLEQKLRALVVATGAKAAMAGLMVPDTGEILALANLPNYDLNRFWEFGTEERRNRFVDDSFDLAGMNRLYRATAALDLRLAPSLEGWTTSQAVQPVGGGVQTGEQPGTASPAPQPQSAPPAHHQQVAWNWVQNGVYVSPEAVGLGQFGVDSAEFVRFAERVGLASKGEVDLPETLMGMKEPEVAAAGRSMEVEVGEGGEAAKSLPPPQEREAITSATPISLLASFCRLINGGRAIMPHVLGAVWHGDQVWDMPVKQSSVALGVRPEVSAALLEGMKKWRPAGQDIFVIESLAEKVGATPAPSPESSAPAVTGEKAEATEGASEPPAHPLVNTVLLGATSLQHPDLAVIIVLEGAKLNPNEGSPIRPVAEELCVQARLAMQKRQGRPSLEELSRREAVFYEKWQKNLEKSALMPASAQNGQGQVMPDVRGMSLRKGLQVLQQHGLRVRVTGSGQVAKQVPAPGTPLKGVDQCVLELASMR